MNSNKEIKEPEDSVEEIQAENTSSVDDFIKELEAKEKDLHITADYKIELAESDYDIETVPDFVQQDLAKPAVDQSGPPATAGAKPRIYELEKEVEALKDRIANLRMERNDIQEKSDRRLKDFESYKYRMDRERRGAFINQIGNLAQKMLPVLDNLDRAVHSTNELSPEKREEFKQFLDGISLVNKQVNEVFAEMGVEPIATVGETFDPNLHEAVSTDERTDMPANTISVEMLKGYRIGNMVIRHSMVKVTKSPQSNNEEMQDDAADEPMEPIAEPTDLLQDDTSQDEE